MKKYIWILAFVLSCEKPPLQQPVGTKSLTETSSVSISRARDLNTLEREQITEWIKTQGKAFYPTTMNYWVDLQDFDRRAALEKGTKIAYQYELYDFASSKIYDRPFIHKHDVIGKIQDLPAVVDALFFLREGEQATLLVPSILAFGTYGDNNKIQNDVPLMIKITRNSP